MYCQNCGHRLGKDAKYCMACGEKVVEEMEKKEEGTRIFIPKKEEEIPPYSQFPSKEERMSRRQSRTGRSKNLIKAIRSFVDQNRYLYGILLLILCVLLVKNGFHMVEFVFLVGIMAWTYVISQKNAKKEIFLNRKLRQTLQNVRQKKHKKQIPSEDEAVEENKERHFSLPYVSLLMTALCLYGYFGSSFIRVKLLSSFSVTAGSLKTSLFGLLRGLPLPIMPDLLYVISEKMGLFLWGVPLIIFLLQYMRMLKRLRKFLAGLYLLLVIGVIGSVYYQVGLESVGIAFYALVIGAFGQLVERK